MSPVRRKRETDGRYAHQGGWDRLCVCGHTLGVHSAGSPADCLLYSFDPGPEVRAKQRVQAADCGCERFRLSRRQP